MHAGPAVSRWPHLVAVFSEPTGQDRDPQRLCPEPAEPPAPHQTLEGADTWEGSPDPPVCSPEPVPVGGEGLALTRQAQLSHRGPLPGTWSREQGTLESLHSGGCPHGPGTWGDGGGQLDAQGTFGAHKGPWHRQQVREAGFYPVGVCWDGYGPVCVCAHERVCLIGCLLGVCVCFCFKTACFARVADASVTVSVPGLVPVSRCVWKGFEGPAAGPGPV